MSKKEKIKELFRNNSHRTRRVAEFKREFLEYSPGIGSDALARLNTLFPKKIKLTTSQKASFMIDLAWSSSRLEGNPYSHLDTIKLLNHGTLSETATLEDAQMIINHKHAFDLIKNTTDISLRMMRQVHKCLADPGNIEGETEHFLKKDELGVIRDTQPMEIAHTAYIPPCFYPGTGTERIYDLIDFVANKASSIEDPVEASFYLLTRVPYVQAFYDANKRTSRVMANVPLLAAERFPLSFDITNRKDYVEAVMSVYEFTDTDIFRDVFVESYVDSHLKYYPMNRVLDEDVRLNLNDYQKSLAAFVLEGNSSPKVDLFLSEINKTKKIELDSGLLP